MSLAGTIQEMQVYRFDLPLKEVFTIATMSLGVARNLLVRLRTSQGLTGWGEASPFRAIVGETQATAEAAAAELRPLVLGRDPLAIGPLMEELDRHLPHHGTLKSALDMALHDLAAQACGLPLYAYLGGERRELETDLTIGIGDPGTAGDKARRYQAMGFRSIKVKLGQDDRDDLRRLENVRAAVDPDIRVRIDANQGWDRVRACRNLDAYRDLDIQFCEQPCAADDLQGLAWISRHAAIPVMADESLFTAAQALELIQRDACPYFNVKLSKSGGLHQAGRIAAVAAAGRRPCMLGCMSESLLGITAAAHFACAHPVFRFFDLDSCLEHAENPILGGARYLGGTIALPDGPGIGAWPDPEGLKTLQVVP